jgi:hypothetical protein
MDSFDCAHRLADCGGGRGDIWIDSYTTLLSWFASLGGHEFWLLLARAAGCGVLLLLLVMCTRRLSHPSRA